jgi:hypothetical protein
MGMPQSNASNPTELRTAVQIRKPHLNHCPAKNLSASWVIAIATIQINSEADRSLSAVAWSASHCANHPGARNTESAMKVTVRADM